MLRRLSLLAPVLVGLVLRTCSMPTTFTEDGIELYGTDAYFHLRQTERVVADYPHVPGFDPRLHHPEGATVLYPGGFHLLAASVALGVGGGHSRYRTQVVCALSPLLLYLLTCLVVMVIATRYALVTRAESCWLRPFAALSILALLPPAVYLTSVGNFDHHPFETLFLLLTVAMLAELRERPGEAKAVAAGVVLGAMELVWLQSVVFLLPFAVLALFQRRALYAMAVAVAGVFYLAVFLLASRHAWIDPNQISLAQPLVAVLLVLPALVRLLWPRPAKLAAALLATATGLVLLRRELGALLQQVAETALGTNPFLVMATESRSLGPADLSWLVMDYGLLLFAAPVFLALALRSRRRAGTGWPLVLLYLLALALMLLQNRFASLFIGAMVLTGAELAAALGDRLRGRPVVLAAALVVLLFPPHVLDIRPQSIRAAHGGFGVVKQACLALRGSACYPELKRQGLGVLARWDLGHWILTYCDLPVVSSPMTASREAREHNARAMRLFYATDTARVHRTLKRWRVGLVMADLPSPRFQKWGDALGIHEQFVRRQGEGWTFEPRIFSTFQGLLSFAPPKAWPAWLEPVYASPQTADIDGRRFPLLVVARVR